MKCLAIIPARSGSKGLKHKNIYNVMGKPLIAYTIEGALRSGCFSKVMVSTDSKEYAEIALQYGAEVPFLRGDLTSQDNSGSWDVVREVLKKYAELGEVFDYVALLQPTSPLRNEVDIKESFRFLQKQKATNLTSVVEVAHPLQWCFPLSEDFSLQEFSKSPFHNLRRQELQKYFQENGAIYWVDAQKIEKDSYNLYADNCVAYIMPRERSVDVDSMLDIIIMEGILQWREKNGSN